MAKKFRKAKKIGILRSPAMNATMNDTESVVEVRVLSSNKILKDPLMDEPIDYQALKEEMATAQP